MRNPNIYVLSTSRPIQDEEAEVLSLVARQLYRDKRKSQQFRGRTCEGMVSTRFVFGRLGQFSGIVFESQIDTNTYTKRTKFIVSTDGLEHEFAEDMFAVERTSFPDGALQEFEDAPGDH